MDPADIERITAQLEEEHRMRDVSPRYPLDNGFSVSRWPADTRAMHFRQGIAGVYQCAGKEGPHDDRDSQQGAWYTDCQV